MPKQSTKYILLFALLCLVLGLLGNYILQFEYNSLIAKYASSTYTLGKLIGVICIFNTIKPFRKHIIGFIFLFVLFTGFLFKIEHLPGASILLSVGVLGLMLNYIVLFLGRKPKQKIDYLIVVWILAAGLFVLFKLERMPFWSILAVIENVLFVSVLLMLLLRKKEKQLAMPPAEQFLEQDKKA